MAEWAMQTLPGKSILKAEALAGTKALGCKRPGISRNKKAHSDENEQEEEKVALGPLVNQSKGPGFPWAGRAAQPQPTLRELHPESCTWRAPSSRCARTEGKTSHRAVKTVRVRLWWPRVELWVCSGDRQLTSPSTSTSVHSETQRVT